MYIYDIITSENDVGQLLSLTATFFFICWNSPLIEYMIVVACRCVAEDFSSYNLVLEVLAVR